MSRLDEIKARLAAATPGPWGHDSNGSNAWFIFPVKGKQMVCGDDWPIAHADAELLASAPADLAYLIAEVERLRDALRAIRATGGVYDSCWCGTTCGMIADRALGGEEHDPPGIKKL